MTIQSPDNYISRVRNGYKKGSKILLIRSCGHNTVKQIEQLICNKFKSEFEQHRDGHEHFIGCFKRMIQIINTIIDANDM